MPLERASSFVSLSFSLLSLSFSFSKSTRSSSGRYATASGITTDTASSPIPALPCCTVISLVNARFTYTSLLSSNIFLTDSSSLVYDILSSYPIDYSNQVNYLAALLNCIINPPPYRPSAQNACDEGPTKSVVFTLLRTGGMTRIKAMPVAGRR